jgi:hypothetical protein
MKCAGPVGLGVRGFSTPRGYPTLNNREVLDPWRVAVSRRSGAITNEPARKHTEMQRRSLSPTPGSEQPCARRQARRKAITDQHACFPLASGYVFIRYASASMTCTDLVSLKGGPWDMDTDCPSAMRFRALGPSVGWRCGYRPFRWDMNHRGSFPSCLSGWSSQASPPSPCTPKTTEDILESQDHYTTNTSHVSIQSCLNLSATQSILFCHVRDVYVQASFVILTNE